MTEREVLQPPAGGASPMLGGGRARRRMRALWMRLALAAVAPVVFLVLLELLLRACSFGYDPHFFVPIPGRGELTGNERFGERFFPPELTQPPVRFVLPARKAPGVYRVFVLGGSAAAGVPAVPYNFGRILEVMLRDAFPGHAFEVVNTAMVAINSHVVREIAAEAARHQPDLFVIYLGNNEVVGPYGAGTIFGPQRGSLWAIRAGIRLRATRAGQLLSRIVRWLASDGARFTKWRGMEMFLGQEVPAESPRLQSVYRNFRANLADICRIARRGGAQVLLCTVATNLRDCPPLASAHGAGYANAGRTEWDAAFSRGIQAQKDGRWSEAAEAYREALGIDPDYAELPYREAQCLLELGRDEAAKAQFIAARDADVLRFRADTTINGVIREAARVNGVRLVDAEQAFADSPLAEHGVPGGGLFYEHCHGTFEGNYLLAASVFRGVAGLLAAAGSAARTAAPIEALRMEMCAERLAFTGWNRYEMSAKMLSMMSRPPFTNQLGHDAMLAARRQALESLTRFLTKEQLAGARLTYERALARRPEDVLLRLNYVRLLARVGDYAQEEMQWTRLVDALPQDTELRYDQGTALLRLGKYDQARACFREALRLRPGFAPAHGNLAIALSAEGRTDEAMDECRRAIRCDPAYLTPRRNLAKLLTAAGRREEAQQASEAADRIERGGDAP